MSKFLFSPDAAQPSRILLSKEVRNAYDYHKCIRQFKDRTWPHALLRFTVFDEAPRNSNLNSEYFHPFLVCVRNHFILQSGPNVPTFTNMAGCGRSTSISEQPVVPPCMKHSVSFQMPRDDTMMSESSNRSDAYVHPQLPMPPAQHQSSAQGCCPVSQGKAEIKAMLHNFQEDLSRVMTINFGQPLPPTSWRPISQVDVGPTSAPPPFLCSLCTQHRQGMWYSCDICHVIVVCIYDL